MKSIGLKRKTVKLVQHNPQWKKLFKVEEKRLKEGFRDWILGYDVEIKHIGSTAIPGINAKPIIDILIGVKSKDKEDIHWTQGSLEKLGYTLIPQACEEDKLFFALGNDARRTHHVHVTVYDNHYWKNDLMFRDYLRSHHDVAKKYDKLKKELSKRYSNDRTSYTKNKEPFIQSVLDKARGEVK